MLIAQTKIDNINIVTTYTRGLEYFRTEVFENRTNVLEVIKYDNLVDAIHGHAETVNKYSPKLSGKVRIEKDVDELGIKERKVTDLETGKVIEHWKREE